MREGGRRHRAAGRQYRPRRGRRAAQGHRAVPGAARPHPRGQRLQRHHHRRSRLYPEERPGCGQGGGLHLPPVARLRRLLPDRRQHRDQCGRRERAALRQYPRPRSRARSGSGRRADLERSQGSAQGQYGLRPEESLHRVGRDARHYHRRGAEAVSAAQDAGGRLRRLRIPPCGARPLREPAPARGRRADGLRVHAAFRARDRAQTCPRRHSSA